MGSVSSTNPGVANLLQLLSNVNSPVASSPSAVSALEKAPPSDIAQLSVEAIQLQGMDEMFGILNGPENPASTLTNLLEAPQAAAATEASATANGTAANPAASSTTSLAAQLADAQLEEVQGLFGTGTIGNSSNSLLNVIG
ncbi:MAG: hypothetical protein ABSB35_02705 [Bryobacteraceae bacterium]|jgi:hypothetical protein